MSWLALAGWVVAINGDRGLAYRGAPETGEPTGGIKHDHHVWHSDKVRALVASQGSQVTFFCGGSRNFPKFVGLFDGVFVLEADLETLRRRLDEQPDDERGGKQSERDLIVRLHQTKGGMTFRRTVPSSTPPNRSRARC
ncbi:hypothetical protein A6A08_02400 [Nocardiopsis sp. TSRI0078]|uniref:hypothetical protein n=1 Tax=unclassified Nocardiopsis TaxID=2649073 RepID=UPI00093D2F83|nr:hypothetical protein [Nocardiopsis sp. TSRI0078]OKI23640.1 hypothetical protein A6A08_02400 [Nocardiopsis sp. TSRI0078]